MEVKSENDFPEVRQKISEWRKRHPMFKHDVDRISTIIEEHITNYSKIMVQHRQTKSKTYLEKADRELEEINRVFRTVGKIELLSILSRN